MDDYIKREAFLKTWCESYCRPKQNCREDCSFYDAITQFPSADVRENKRGKWVRPNDNPFVKPKCSVCGMSCFGLHAFDCDESEFCPSCGADMRGKQDE